MTNERLTQLRALSETLNRGTPVGQESLALGAASIAISELLDALTATQARIAELIESMQQLGREHVRERANLQATIDGLINATQSPGTVVTSLSDDPTRRWVVRSGQVLLREADFSIELGTADAPDGEYYATLLLKPEVE
jgi:hypothetical protein